MSLKKNTQTAFERIKRTFQNRINHRVKSQAESAEIQHHNPLAGLHPKTMYEYRVFLFWSHDRD